MVSCCEGLKETQRNSSINIKEKIVKENNHSNDAQENTQMRLMEVMKTIQDLRMELNKETGALNKTQAEMQVKFKNPLTQLENAKGSLTRVK